MIPLWSELLGRYSAAGRPVRAVGMLEPIRSEAQLAEDVLNEALLNLAFEHAADFRLRCPYDARSTPPELLGSLDKTHPVLLNGGPRHSAEFAPAEVASSTFRSAPPPAPAHVERWPVTLPELGGLREKVWQQATGHGLDKDRVDDAVLATHEICKNSIRFGGGGTLAVWTEDDALICEVADSGHIERADGGPRPALADRRGRPRAVAGEPALRPGPGQVDRDRNSGPAARRTVRPVRTVGSPPYACEVRHRSLRARRTGG